MGRTHIRIAAGALVVMAALLAAATAGGNFLPGLIPASAQVRPPADSLSAMKDRLLLYERSFRPSTYDAAMPPVLNHNDSLALTAGRNWRDTYAAPETVQGFRIQVMNTNSYDESSAMRTTLLQAFDTWWVYVLFDSPTYKVRIGDFRTRLEAKNALEQIQAKGFSNAWLVPDKVVLHLPSRAPLAAPIDTSLVK